MGVWETSQLIRVQISSREPAVASSSNSQPAVFPVATVVPSWYCATSRNSHFSQPSKQGPGSPPVRQRMARPAHGPWKEARTRISPTANAPRWEASVALDRSPPVARQRNSSRPSVALRSSPGRWGASGWLLEPTFAGGHSSVQRIEAPPGA
ncbi:hypothetical protein PVAP13_2NG257503 [Panicum virgatum]|uniref:Uncharacterized protein n=1 Tax=Panicum virgatum TaxID=38727 RepID=A0A8T0VIY7_PANVG|nr:hypothetical protein PVAP13_2NG257503 [Panicum virgatum]